jgi:hypothetical protein
MLRSAGSTRPAHTSPETVVRVDRLATTSLAPGRSAGRCLLSTRRGAIEQGPTIRSAAASFGQSPWGSRPALATASG